MRSASPPRLTVRSLERLVPFDTSQASACASKKLSTGLIAQRITFKITWDLSVAWAPAMAAQLAQYVDAGLAT